MRGLNAPPNGKNGNQKIIATTVSSREMGQKRNRHRKSTKRQKHNEDKLKIVDGDFPTCMRYKKETTTMTTQVKTKTSKEKEEEDSNTTTSMEDVPLCGRKTEGKSKDGSSSDKKNNEEK